MKVYMVLTYLQYQYKRSLNTHATVIVYNIRHVYLELLPTRTKLHVWGVC